MWFIYFLSFISSIIQIIFVVFSIAAGLYYLAELVEEYTVITKRIIWWLTMCVILIYLGIFAFEEFPISLIVCGLISQISHLYLLRTFPFVMILSPGFFLAIVMLIINHYLAFQYFGSNYYIFSEVIGFFTLCLWIVPFSLFVSLSANENVLPTLSESRPLLGDDNDVVTNYFSRKGKKYGLLSFFNYAKDSILPQRNKKAF